MLLSDKYEVESSSRALPKAWPGPQSQGAKINVDIKFFPFKFGETLRVWRRCYKKAGFKKRFEKRILVGLCCCWVESVPAVTKRSRNCPRGQVSGPPEGQTTNFMCLFFGLWELEMNLQPSVMSENVASLIFYYYTSVLLHLQH